MTTKRASRRSDPVQSETELDWPAHKLRPPQVNPQAVLRAHLVEQLLGTTEVNVITLIAPAGYGKTTLLTQWAQGETRPVAWLSLDRTDRDPATLLTDIALSLRSAGVIPADVAVVGRFTSRTALAAGVSRLLGMIDRTVGSAILILDHKELISSRAAIDVVAELVHRIEGRITVAVASRKSIRLPLGAWRSEGRLLELGTSDLRMSREEARSLLSSMGVGVDRLDELVERTEGWPVGLYLAGRAIQAGSTQMPPPVGVTGDDRFITDYLRDQIISGMSRATLSFLTRTSILDELNGGLCDRVLEINGSAEVLAKLEGANLPIVSLDRARTWYRYHQLLQEMLQRELELREPEAIAGLHGRASAWFEAQGRFEQAVHHAQLAGDFEAVARILADTGRLAFAGGHVSGVIRWLDWLESEGQLENFPNVAGVGAMAFTLVGDASSADRWTGGVFGDHEDAGSDGITPVALLARALRCKHGLAQMRKDAETARATLPPGSEWEPAALLIGALSHLWAGDLDVAEPLVIESISLGDPLSARVTTSFAWAERSVIALSRGAWGEADAHAARSLAVILDQGLEAQFTSGLGFAVAARSARHRGELSRATSLLAQASNIRPFLNATMPGVAVQTLLEMSAAYLEMSDVAAARTTIREAEDIVRQRPRLGTLTHQLEAMKAGLSDVGPAPIGAFALTKSELRVLPLLSSHLSFPEIGERLYISRHTVKTHAMSIYRKLGASSRSEAVDRARAAGFLSD